MSRSVSSLTFNNSKKTTDRDFISQHFTANDGLLVNIDD